MKPDMKPEMKPGTKPGTYETGYAPFNVIGSSSGLRRGMGGCGRLNYETGYENRI